MGRPVHNFISLFIGNVGSRILGFFATVYLARVLDVSGFGKLQFALAIYSYGLIFTNPGLLLLGTREVAKGREKMDEYLPTLLGIRILLSLLSFLTIFILLLFLPKPEETKTLILFYSLSLFAQAFLLEWLFQGMEEMDPIGLSRISLFLVYLPLIYLFVRVPEEILRVPLFYFAGNLVSTLLLFFIYWKRHGKAHFRFNASLLIPILRESLPLGLATVMIQIYLYFDTLLLGLFKGDEEVGWYNAAYKLVFFVLLLDRVFTETFFPLISRHYEESLERLVILLKKYAKWIIALVLPIGVGGTLLASPIMNLVYGSRYENGIIAFQILIWVVTLSSINSVYSIGLIGCHRERNYTIAIAFGTAANLLLNFLLIPPFGLAGAASATLLSEGIMFTGMVIQFEKVVKVEFWNYLLKPLFSSLVMGVLIHLFRTNHPLVLVSLGALSYFLLLILMKGISLEEIPLSRKR